jgi:hypothetical protein
MVVPRICHRGDISLLRPHEHLDLRSFSTTVFASLGHPILHPFPSPFHPPSCPATDGRNTEPQSSCGEAQHQRLHPSPCQRSYKTQGHPDSFWPEIPVSTMSQEFQPHREFDAAPSQPLVQCSPPAPPDSWLTHQNIRRRTGEVCLPHMQEEVHTQRSSQSPSPHPWYPARAQVARDPGRLFRISRRRPPRV